jgi:protein-S-isoprenylcysteine O-methyltransferase Ste14
VTNSRVPALGDRGEGWVALQIVLMLAIPFEAWREAREAVTTSADPAVRVIGGAALLGGVGLLLWSSAVLRKSGAFSVLPRPVASGEMVVNGPYRIVRHPIYAGLIVAAIGIALIRASIVLSVLAVALAIVLDLKRRREEAWLTAKYPTYARYRTRTRALIPFVY